MTKLEDYTDSLIILKPTMYSTLSVITAKLVLGRTGVLMHEDYYKVLDLVVIRSTDSHLEKFDSKIIYFKNIPYLSTLRRYIRASSIIYFLKLEAI